MLEEKLQRRQFLVDLLNVYNNDFLNKLELSASHIFEKNDTKYLMFVDDNNILNLYKGFVLTDSNLVGEFIIQNKLVYIMPSSLGEYSSNKLRINLHLTNLSKYNIAKIHYYIIEYNNKKNFMHVLNVNVNKQIDKLLQKYIKDKELQNLNSKKIDKYRAVHFLFNNGDRFLSLSKTLWLTSSEAYITSIQISI